MPALVEAASSRWGQCFGGASSKGEHVTAVSGITPSGRLTLGSYLGALRRFTEHTEEPGFFFVADLHAMTTRHDPRRLTTLTRETAVLLLASGLAQESVFIQSAVPAHGQLAYLPVCTPMLVSCPGWCSTNRRDGATR